MQKTGELYKKKTERMAIKMNDTMKLEAWCEWRKWCSILRVKNPQPTRDELDAGKADTLLPDTRKNYHRYLCNCIFSGVKRFDLQTDSPYSVYENIGYAHNREDFLSFFDELMNGKMPRVKGIYKNYVFEKAERSAQPPLQVIRGKITGQTGYINDIVKKYLRLNDSGASVGPQSDAILNARGKMELNAPIAKESGSTYEEFISVEDQQFQEFDFDDKTVETFCKHFSLQELAILLACGSYELPTTSPELHTFTGCGKTIIYEKLPFLKARFRMLLRGIKTVSTVHFMAAVNNWIISALSAEKAALPLLKVIEAKINTEQQKLDAVWERKHQKEMEKSENE